MVIRKSIPILKATQWIATWQPMIAAHQPEEGSAPREFFIASMPLKDLRELAGVSTRQLEERRRANPQAGYQRPHEVERSKKIARYISYGYPLSSQTTLNPEENPHLIHPGWLPTAILVNLIGSEESRRRHGQSLSVHPEMVVSIKEDEGRYSLEYPDPIAGFESQWKRALQPIEVIDGQHRLYAVDHLNSLDEYEVPVIIFNRLSQALQAYLFWVINVEPKKINPSLAFDLYPELRRLDWLERGEGIKVYQEHRAQELTEVLWRHPESVWRDRIELHGSRVEGHVSNAAFIRSLMASFVRRWKKEDDKIGGLFGSIAEGINGTPERVLPWKRTQQAAFLIYVWRKLYDGLGRSNAAWAISCRKAPLLDSKKTNPHKLDLAFAGPYTLLATDQGARAIMTILNAMFFIQYSELNLESWESPFPVDAIDDDDVSEALGQLSQFTKINDFLDGVAETLFHTEFDWRTSSSPDISKNMEVRQQQSAYRGSSGYTILQQRALQLLEKATMPTVASAAQEIKARLGW